MATLRGEYYKGRLIMQGDEKQQQKVYWSGIHDTSIWANKTEFELWFDTCKELIPPSFPKVSLCKFGWDCKTCHAEPETCQATAGDGTSIPLAREEEDYKPVNLIENHCRRHGYYEQEIDYGNPPPYPPKSQIEQLRTKIDKWLDSVHPSFTREDTPVITGGKDKWIRHDYTIGIDYADSGSTSKCGYRPYNLLFSKKQGCNILEVGSPL